MHFSAKTRSHRVDLEEPRGQLRTSLRTRNRVDNCAFARENAFPRHSRRKAVWTQRWAILSSVATFQWSGRASECVKEI